LVSNWLGLVRPARIAPLAAVLFGVALLDGCNSLSSAPFASQSVPTDAGGVPLTDDGPGVGTSCYPGNVETFSPAAYRAATSAGQGACVPVDGVDPIQVYYDDCFGPTGSRAACDAFGQISPANAACMACIVTAGTAAAYGPLVLTDGFVQTNVAGCLELEAPLDLACAQAQQALSDCELAACSANCPVVDQASLVVYEKCAEQADATGCQAYYAAAACLRAQADAGVDGGPESVCLAPSFEAFYQAVVPLFCGQTSADAGLVEASAGDAGPSDAEGEVRIDAGSSSPDAHGDAAIDALAFDASIDVQAPGDGGPLEDGDSSVSADGADAK
jgi:hypothetical protein